MAAALPALYKWLLPQRAHSAASASEYVPGKHGEQSGEPPPANVPGSQGRHSSISGSSEKYPGSHGRHDDMPGSGPYVPAMQGRQSLCEVALLSARADPAGHFWQEVAPGSGL